MNTFFKKKIFTPFTALLIALASIGAAFGVSLLVSEKTLTASSTILTVEQLYEKSVFDAMVAEQDEVKPLVIIEKSSDMVTWNETNDKILLLSWNDCPDSYVQGENITLSYGEVWTFTDKEIAEWYNENKNDVTDWILRLKQLIGLPPASNYTHFTAFWASPEDVYRPAYVTDIEQSDMRISFDDDENEEYKNWFDDNILFSYYEADYPWTRLGYTYDWADNGKEYGLSEFLIKKDARAEIEFTKTTKEFVEWLSAKVV